MKKWTQFIVESHFDWDAFFAITDECKDILIDLIDAGIYVRVYKGESKSSKWVVVVEIGNQSDAIKLKQFEYPLKHLISYMSEVDFTFSEESYYSSLSWDLIEKCPKCGSVEVGEMMGKPKCKKCHFSSIVEDFTDDKHPLTLGELKWSIDKNYWPDYLHLVFKKN